MPSNVVEVLEVKNKVSKAMKPYTALSINDGGTVKDVPVLAAVLAQFTGPGTYEAVWQANGKYQNLAALKKVGNGNALSVPQTTQATNGESWLQREKALTARQAFVTAGEVLKSVAECKGENVLQIKNQEEAVQFARFFVRAMMKETALFAGWESENADAGDGQE